MARRNYDREERRAAGWGAAILVVLVIAGIFLVGLAADWWGVSDAGDDAVTLSANDEAVQDDFQQVANEAEQETQEAVNETREAWNDVDQAGEGFNDPDVFGDPEDDGGFE